MKAVSSAAFRGLVSRRALQRQRVGILPSLMFYQQRPTHLLPSHAHTSASATMSTSVSPDAPRSGTIRIPVAPDSPDAVISWRCELPLAVRTGCVTPPPHPSLCMQIEQVAWWPARV